MPRRQGTGPWSRWFLAGAVLPFTLALSPGPAGATATANTSGDWTTYLGSVQHRGYNSHESVITPTTAPNLKLSWTAKSQGNLIFTQPIVSNGQVFWGSFDGYERATTTSGTLAWQQFVGTTSPGPPCSMATAGVASTATVTNIKIGAATSVLYVGGGDGQFYALDAKTGTILWTTRLGPSPSNFIWGSPAVYNGSVYIGVASFGDCPLVQGQLVKLDARTGAIQHVFDTVPTGCIGAGVWSSPTVDRAAGTIYFATGNGGTCTTAEPLAQAGVEVTATDLSLVGSWQIPASSELKDGDFGATTTLFSFRRAGVLHNMVGVVNKNGVYYAFARDGLPAGPAWELRVGTGGGGPRQGTADVSPSAWDGKVLYIAGASGTVAGTTCAGSLTAVRPATGGVIWRICLSQGTVLGAVTVVPGVVEVGAGPNLLLFSAATGHLLLSYSTSSTVWGAGTISNGVLYQGDMGGTLYALAP